MMQPTSTSQVASTQRWMTHHHQYWSTEMLGVKNMPARYRPASATRSSTRTPEMPLHLPFMNVAATL